MPNPIRKRGNDMVSLNEYGKAIIWVGEHVYSNAITPQQGIEQIKGILIVLDIKEDRCTHSVREKIQRAKSIAKSTIAGFEKLQSEKH